MFNMLYLQLINLIKKNRSELADIISLPKDYTTQSGVLLESFGNVADWSVSGSGNVSEDLVNVKVGSKSLNIKTATDATTTMITKNISLDMSNALELLQLNLWVEDKSALGNVQLILSTDTGITNKYTAYVYASNLINGWNYFRIAFADFSKVGSPNPVNTMLRLRLIITPVNGKSCNISFDSLYGGIKAIPNFLIMFDDGWADVYNVAYPIMDAAGIRGTCYLVKNLLDTTGYMTTAQVTELYNKGWDMANHAQSHVNLTTLTEAQQETEIKANHDWLLSLGFFRAAKHVAYPGGNFNADTLIAMKNTGMLTGRTTNPKTQQVPVESLFTLFTRTYSDSIVSTDALAKTFVDRCFTQGGTALAYTHKVNVSPTDTSSDMNTARFQLLINYLIARKISTPTISEWYTNILNPQNLLRHN